MSDFVVNVQTEITEYPFTAEYNQDLFSATLTVERPNFEVSFEDPDYAAVIQDLKKYAYLDAIYNTRYVDSVSVIFDSGKVYQGTLREETVYRYISDSKDANGDALRDEFYENFDGTQLTNLIVER